MFIWKPVQKIGIYYVQFRIQGGEKLLFCFKKKFIDDK